MRSIALTCDERDDSVRAFVVETGALLDAERRRTEDVTKVRGYRPPTEAEWE